MTITIFTYPITMMDDQPRRDLFTKTLTHPNRAEIVAHDGTEFVVFDRVGFGHIWEADDGSWSGQAWTPVGVVIVAGQLRETVARAVINRVREEATFGVTDGLLTDYRNYRLSGDVYVDRHHYKIHGRPSDHPYILDCIARADIPGPSTPVEPLIRFS